MPEALAVVSGIQPLATRCLHDSDAEYHRTLLRENRHRSEKNRSLLLNGGGHQRERPLLTGLTLHFKSLPSVGPSFGYAFRYPSCGSACPR
jgi:hypothetical protein